MVLALQYLQILTLLEQEYRSVLSLMTISYIYTHVHMYYSDIYIYIPEDQVGPGNLISLFWPCGTRGVVSYIRMVYINTLPDAAKYHLQYLHCFTVSGTPLFECKVIYLYTLYSYIHILYGISQLERYVCSTYIMYST